ncbi:hypothetical protein J6590_029811 [Homalodisca vitripennis]|nr:hypothetical protein J6590_029811 [Homalodisca vitripennis]
MISSDPERAALKRQGNSVPELHDRANVATTGTPIGFNESHQCCRVRITHNSISVVFTSSSALLIGATIKFILLKSAKSSLTRSTSEDILIPKHLLGVRNKVPSDFNSSIPAQTSSSASILLLVTFIDSSELKVGNNDSCREESILHNHLDRLQGYYGGAGTERHLSITMTYYWSSMYLTEFGSHNPPFLTWYDSNAINEQILTRSGSL